jgi:hypothetical protein
MQSRQISEVFYTATAVFSKLRDALIGSILCSGKMMIIHKSKKEKRWYLRDDDHGSVCRRLPIFPGQIKLFRYQNRPASYTECSNR